MHRRSLPLLFLPLLFLPCVALTAQTFTSQNDNSRTGANTHETILTPANVNQTQFGKIFTLKTDGGIYAQPLFAPHLAIPGKGAPDVLFVATENDSVYAFDANNASAAPLWHTTFLKADAKVVDSRDVQCPFIQPGIGITPTPVIDPESGTIYVLARTAEGGGIISSPTYKQKLRALAVTTGQEKFGGPIEITAPGFDALHELPRAGLALVNGQVILTWGSSCDAKPYHGWIMAYDARTLKQTSAFNTSPDSGESGIWQADMAPAADAQGNIYVATGNGVFTAAANGRDYGDTLLKMGIDNGKLTVRDYFTPSNEQRLNASDQDLGSGGPMLLPDQPGPHPHQVLIGGKSGDIYVLDRDHLGHLQSKESNPLLQVLHFAGGVYAAPAFWNGHLYTLATTDFLSDFPVVKGQVSDKPTSQSTLRFGNPGATPAISANGTKDGIVWFIQTKEWNDFADRPAILRAFDATNLAREIYNSEENGARDHAAPAMRFTIPTIANGRVYVPAKNEVDVYGLRISPNSDTTGAIQSHDGKGAVR